MLSLSKGSEYQTSLYGLLLPMQGKRWVMPMYTQSGPPPGLMCFLQTLPSGTMFPKSLVQCQETCNIFLALKDVAGNCVRDLWCLPACLYS